MNWREGVNVKGPLLSPDCFSSQVDTNNIGTNAGHLRKGFVMKNKKVDLDPSRDPQGRQTELPDHTSVPLQNPHSHAPPLPIHTKRDVISSKDQDKRVCLKEKTHACRHHLITVYSWPKA